MTILDETLNKLLRDTTNLILNIPNFSIRAKQFGSPRPTGSYATVDLLNNNSIGWEQKIYSDETATEVRSHISGLREVAMSLNFYRDSAIDNANAVRTGLVRDSVQSLFKSAKVGLTTRSNIREISESLENGWEERAQFDVFLNVVGTDTDIINNILSANIDGEFQTRNLIFDIDIEVN